MDNSDSFYGENRWHESNGLVLLVVNDVNCTRSVKKMVWFLNTHALKKLARVMISLTFSRCGFDDVINT